MKNTLNEEKLKAHFTDEDKKTIEDCSSEGLQFLESDPETEAIEAKQKELEAKNGLENYCFQMKNTLDDEKLKTHFTDDDKKVIQDTSAEGL